MEKYLNETEFLNYSHPDFDLFLRGFDTNVHQKQLAINLYELIRDAYLYDPHHLDLRSSALKANSLLFKKRAWCVEKAIVLAACARKLGIPAQLGYAIVKNHIGTERLEHYLRRKEIVFHGYVSLFVEGKWVKCTPAFDKRVCNINKVEPLQWDGSTDSLFQAFVGEKQFMEYLHDYGLFEDVPIDLMNAEMKSYYPHLFAEKYDTKEFSFFHK